MTKPVFPNVPTAALTVGKTRAAAFDGSPLSHVLPGSGSGVALCGVIAPWRGPGLTEKDKLCRKCVSEVKRVVAEFERVFAHETWGWRTDG